MAKLAVMKPAKKPKMIEKAMAKHTENEKRDGIGLLRIKILFFLLQVRVTSSDGVSKTIPQ